MPVLAYPRLALTGLVTFFGSMNSAVPFLLDLFHVPADTFQLFVASSVINARFGTLVAAMHTLAVALLSTCAMTGLMRFDRARIVRYLVITAVLTVAVIGGTRVVFGRVFHQEYTKDKVLAAMHLKRQTTPATVHRVPIATASAPERGAILSLIKQRGALRVGYMRDSLPYAFFNAADELVGLDVEMAYRLAAELNVPLEFVPIDRERMVEQVNAGDCDILMSGVAITTMRASQMVFSTDYVDETMAFIVPDSARGDYASWPQLEKLTGAAARNPGRAVLHPEDARASASGRIEGPSGSAGLLQGARAERARRDGIRGRARFSVDADVPELLGRDSGARSGESAARLCDWPAGSGVCDVREHLDRTEEKRRNCRLPL